MLMRRTRGGEGGANEAHRRGLLILDTVGMLQARSDNIWGGGQRPPSPKMVH